MGKLSLIEDHDLGSYLIVFDRMGEETHYIDLTKLSGISVGPGDSLHLRYPSGCQTLLHVKSEDAEKFVARWVSMLNGKD